MKHDFSIYEEIAVLNRQVEELDRLGQIIAGQVQEINFQLNGYIKIEEKPDTPLDPISDLMWLSAFKNKKGFDFELKYKISESIALSMIGVLLGEKRRSLDLLLKKLEK